MSLDSTQDFPQAASVDERSVVEHDGTLYFLARCDGARLLGVRGDAALFEGAQLDPSGVNLCPLTPINAAALRTRLPWLRPVPLGLETSAGFGDRLGLATPGHIRAIRRVPTGADTIAPLFADDLDAQRLGIVSPLNSGLFASLNSAAWNTGLTIRVPRGARPERPLRVLVPAFAETTLPRILVDVAEQAEVTVVEEHYGGAAEAHRVIGVTEVLVGQGAHVKHVLVQRWSENVSGWLSVRARVERDGSYQGANASLGGDRVKLELGADLALSLVGPKSHGMEEAERRISIFQADRFRSRDRNGPAVLRPEGGEGDAFRPPLIRRGGPGRAFGE